MPLLCSIGLHNYAWKYLSDASCEQTGTCQRAQCHKKLTRTQHQYRDWQYVSSTDCMQQRICERHAEHVEKKHKPAHIWGKPLYINDGDCERIATCERNPAHTKSSIDHIWGPPVRGANCVMKRHCQRCPTGVMFMGRQHDFHSIEIVNGRKMRRCRYCSHREFLAD